MAKNENQPVTKKELHTELAALESRLDKRSTGLKKRMAFLEKKMDTQTRNLYRSIKSIVEEQIQGLEGRLTLRFDKVLNKIDPFISEIQTAQKERNLINAHLSDHEERIEKIESIVVDKKQPKSQD